MTDPRDVAERQLQFVTPTDPHTAATTALAYAMLALCDRIDELTSVVIIPVMPTQLHEL